MQTGHGPRSGEGVGHRSGEGVTHAQSRSSLVVADVAHDIARTISHPLIVPERTDSPGSM
jgi:hypothetical protein